LLIKKHHEKKAGLRFSTFLLNRENGFAPPLHFEFSKTLDLTQETYFKNIKTEYNINFISCKIADDIVLKGTRYNCNYHLAANVNNKLEMYRIKYFIIQGSLVYIVCNEINVKRFDDHFQAYEVGSGKDSISIKTFHDIFSLPFHIYPLNNNEVFFKIKYVPNDQ